MSNGLPAYLLDCLVFEVNIIADRFNFFPFRVFGNGSIVPPNLITNYSFSSTKPKIDQKSILTGARVMEISIPVDFIVFVLRMTIKSSSIKFFLFFC